MFNCFERNYDIDASVGDAQRCSITPDENAVFVPCPSVVRCCAIDVEADAAVGTRLEKTLCANPAAARNIQHSHTLHKSSRENVARLVFPEQRLTRFPRNKAFPRVFQVRHKLLDSGKALRHRLTRSTGRLHHPYAPMSMS